jgi:hypothetical protein
MRKRSSVVAKNLRLNWQVYRPTGNAERAVDVHDPKKGPRARRPLKNPLVGVVCTLKTEPNPLKRSQSGMKRAIGGKTDIFFAARFTHSCP